MKKTEEISKIAERKREKNLSSEFKKLSESEYENLIKTYPPNDETQFEVLTFGKSKGLKVPKRLADLLKMKSETLLNGYADKTPDYYTDVLVIGGGGAGIISALEAVKHGSVILATKFRIGDGNTVMAEGGIQSALSDGDSEKRHFSDTYNGGLKSGNEKLIEILTGNGKSAIEYLKNLGVNFDKTETGEIKLYNGGGVSRPRICSAKDFTGLEIIRVLRSELLSSAVKILEYRSAIEILTSEDGFVSGVVLKSFDGKITVVRAKSVIVATGGAGRLYYGGFPTTNSFDATADGMVLAYRAGCSFKDADSLQYHPTCAVYPPLLRGSLITEKARSMGAKLLNAYGEEFINSLEKRDAVSSAIIKECSEGRGVTLEDGTSAVVLDTPMIDIINGEGTTAKYLPNVYNTYKRSGIDVTKEPILVYPAMHYQNGGIAIDERAETDIKNLFAVGEVTGGIHGRNRLMGNSLLELVVFGLIAGESAGKSAKSSDFKTPSEENLKRYYADIELIDGFSPIILPEN